MRIYLIRCMPEGKNSDLEERIMKILLAAVNAKYIHSNLAVYSLKAYAEKYAKNEAEAPYAHENRSQLDNWPLNNFLRVHRGSLRIVCLL